MFAGREESIRVIARKKKREKNPIRISHISLSPFLLLKRKKMMARAMTKTERTAETTGVVIELCSLDEELEVVEVERGLVGEEGEAVGV